MVFLYFVNGNPGNSNAPHTHPSFAPHQLITFDAIVYFNNAVKCRWYDDLSKKNECLCYSTRLEISSNHINNSGHKLSYSDTSLRNNIRKAQTLQD